MDEIKLSDDIIKQIKDFKLDDLSKEQDFLINKLILNEELKERYKKYGLCEECKQPNTNTTKEFHKKWCQLCNARRFHQNFKNWTSGSHDIDEFIQNTQLKAKKHEEVLEWIEYDRFENVEDLAKSGSGTAYKAIWKDGYIYYWDSEKDQWERYRYYKSHKAVVLKCLPNSQDIAVELQKIESEKLGRCYGVTKDPVTNNFMMAINYKYGLCEECKQPNTGSSWCKSCNAKRFQQNFKNWTSRNNNIDTFIQQVQLNAKRYEEVLEWIEYDRFENVEFLARGGFGTTFRAIWKDGYIESWDSENDHWKRSKGSKTSNKSEVNFQVALKSLHNSQDITVEFLREVGLHLKMNAALWVVTCYGITKSPDTKNFMMVMKYAMNGSLRHHLDKNFISLDWAKKLFILQSIIFGLKDIHNNELIHRDFHCGNILSSGTENTHITDLGLCQPANVTSGDKQLFGVLPYVAPEALRGKKYTQESDIYGFGIIAHEVCTGSRPYHDIDHGNGLAISICNGLRPKSNFKIPQLIFDIIKQCWDADPSKRPKAAELHDKIYNLFVNAFKGNIDNSFLYKQIQEADEINEQNASSMASSSSISYTTHPQAVYTSRLLDFESLPKPKNTDDGNNSLQIEYSESVAFDFTKLNINSNDESN